MMGSYLDERYHDANDTLDEFFSCHVFLINSH